MGVNGVGNSPIRFTGMASGLDTEAIVKQMMAGDKAKIDKINQNKQTVLWKQEAYREIIDDINSIKSKYFDVLSDDYMLSSNAFSGFDVSYSKDNVTKVTATTGAAEGDYTVEVVQLAKQASVKGSTLITNENKSEPVGSFDDWKDSVITFNVKGTDTSITLGNSFTDMDSLINDINEKISANIDLKGNISVSNDLGAVKLNTISNDTIKIVSSTATDLSAFAGKVLNPTTSTKLTDLDTTGTGNQELTLDLKYYGTTTQIKLDNTSGDKTINDLIQQISNYTSGEVVASFSELTGELTFSTMGTGSSSAIEVTAIHGGLSDAVNINNGLKDNGEDAIAKITPPGSTESTTVTKASNKFSIDNVNYELTKKDTSVVTIAPNVDETFDKVKGFIDKYNDLVGKISSKLEEKKSYSYKPLTAEEKEGMEKEEIEKWEKKAKEGILRNDGALEKMLSSLRSSFFDSVDGAGIAFSKKQLGLDTSADIGQRGKILIKDAEKFKQVLASNGEQVMRLFTKNSDISYNRSLSETDKKDRYDNSGIFQRLSDIMEDNISTFRDNDGRKGILLDKAGIKEDTSFINNMLSKQIETKDKLIKELTSKMFEKENRLYQRFAKLEQAMNGLNSQSSWLASQLGGV